MLSLENTSLGKGGDRRERRREERGGRRGRERGGRGRG